ncbi:MAG: hypothetical protein GF398_15990 [Chitinivibrionales bacterium]|nr:hypothetical protein [Chitinivibrionales bacterium]
MPLRPYLHVANELQRAIHHDPEWDIPGIGALSRQYGVSYCTMQKAVHLLADQGVLNCTVGKKITINPNKARLIGVDAPVARTAQDNFYRNVRQSIVDGTHIVGEPLPKFEFFILEYHVSIHTIVNTCRRLSDEGLIHKVGKKWVVGPRRAALNSPAPLRDTSPVVAMLVGHERAWYKLSTIDHTAPYVGILDSELLKYGFQCRLILSRKIWEDVFVLQTRHSDARPLLRQLGSRLTGSIMCSTSFMRGAYDEWIEMLAPFKKPIIFFDFNNDAGYISRKYPGIRKYFYRFYSDENQALKLAISSLAKCGHRVIGIPYYGHREYSWIRSRVDRIKEIAAGHYPDLKIITSDSTAVDAPHELMRSNPRFREMLQHHAREMLFDKSTALSVDDREPFEQVAANVALSTIPLLKNHQITAVIGLNDVFAREIYFLLNLLGVELPRDLSMISFDNAPASRAYSIATIDYGFARAGYLSAHALIGDIVVRKGVSGNSACECKLINRGSLGVPRKQKRALV